MPTFYNDPERNARTYLTHIASARACPYKYVCGIDGDVCVLFIHCELPYFPVALVRHSAGSHNWREVGARRGKRFAVAVSTSSVTVTGSSTALILLDAHALLCRVILSLASRAVAQPLRAGSSACDRRISS